MLTQFDILETSVAEAQCLGALDEAVKTRTETEKTRTVDETVYSGTVGPSNQAVSSGATVECVIEWESDHNGQEQGWRLCYSAEATAAPTTAAPLPARTALSTACSVHVSSTNGTDSGTCGESTDSSCKSIQKGIERAGDYNTVCVHNGMYQCETGWAGSITKSMMLLGFDAVVD